MIIGKRPNGITIIGLKNLRTGLKKARTRKVESIKKVIDKVAKDMKECVNDKERMNENLNYLQGELYKRGLI